ncbi:MAG TPA: DNA repair protein RadC [Draconibacterium sp.]|jgi:DNA repair protein RadC|nr:DNA repair protein RadC [Draconibacterium sp.]
MNEYKKLVIKEWAVEDRPREKLSKNGPRSLSDAELIAILIGSGNLNETAVELSRRILASVDNNINELGRKSIENLKSFKGIGEAKAITIVAALELGKRRKESDVFNKNKINGSKDAADYFQPLLGDLNHEEFWIMFLDRGNKIQDSFRISQGGISGTVIDVRIILKAALEKGASSIILCHNHPSGTLQASDADLKITRKIIDAAKIMDISVLDHVIIGNDKYYSFADEGML